jgi:hypothetical protein
VGVGYYSRRHGTVGATICENISKSNPRSPNLESLGLLEQWTDMGSLNGESTLKCDMGLGSPGLHKLV